MCISEKNQMFVNSVSLCRRILGRDGCWQRQDGFNWISIQQHQHHQPSPSPSPREISNFSVVLDFFPVVFKPKYGWWQGARWIQQNLNSTTQPSLASSAQKDLHRQQDKLFSLLASLSVGWGELYMVKMKYEPRGWFYINHGLWNVPS